MIRCTRVALIKYEVWFPAKVLCCKLSQQERIGEAGLQRAPTTSSNQKIQSACQDGQGKSEQKMPERLPGSYCLEKERREHERRKKQHFRRKMAEGQQKLKLKTKQIIYYGHHETLCRNVSGRGRVLE